MLKFKNTEQFRNDFKGMIISVQDVDKFKEIAERLIREIPLEKRYRDHTAVGKYKGLRECYIEPDWILIYYMEEDTVTFVRIGTHSNLFKK